MWPESVIYHKRCDFWEIGVIRFRRVWFFFISQNQTFYTHLISFLDKHQTKTHQMICFVNPLLQNPVWFGFDSILGFNWQILAFLIKNFKPKRNFLKNLVLKNAIKRLGRVILGNFSYVCVIFSLEMVWFLAKGVWFFPLKWCDFWQRECVFHPKPSGHTGRKQEFLAESRSLLFRAVVRILKVLARNFFLSIEILEKQRKFFFYNLSSWKSTSATALLAPVLTRALTE